MSQIIYQPELAKMAGLGEKSKTKIIAYCRREGIRFKFNWSNREIWTTQKWIDESESKPEPTPIEFGDG